MKSSTSETGPIATLDNIVTRTKFVSQEAKTIKSDKLKKYVSISLSYFPHIFLGSSNTRNTVFDQACASGI